jgi:hypothetical protein
MYRMENKPYSRNRWLSALGLGALAAVSLSTATAGTVAPKNPPLEAVDWKVNTIAPVTNPIFFEDAIIRSEIRPIFVHHTIDNNFLGGGTAQLYALQLRYAVTDRLALIATQDGYFDVNNDAIANPDGWMDLAAGFKYALIDNPAAQFILTPGLTFHIPTGDRRVFQGRGGGEFNPFVSFQKGFGDLHVSGNLGLRIPVTSDEQNLMAHYSLMVDYYVSRWFIPFVSANFWTNLNDGTNFPGLRSNGYDVINFGGSNANGVTQGMVGVGFRSRITSSIDIGAAYEVAAVRPHGLTNNRLTFDMCIRF